MSVRKVVSANPRDALAAHLARVPSTGFVCTNTRGMPRRRGSLNEVVWKPALAAASLPPTFGFHCMRHTYASGLISAGLHPRVVMAWLGHASDRRDDEHGAELSVFPPARLLIAHAIGNATTPRRG
jgi:integrase